MNTKDSPVRGSVAAFRGALLAAALGVSAGTALAQEAAPPPAPGTVEIGVGGVSGGRYKSGEYNGLQDDGAFGIGNVDLRDSAPHDGPSALRWRVRSRDLGVGTRSAFAEAGVQGRFRLTLGVDQLRRNRSDTYQTPYEGTGTSTLTLPGGWLVPTIASPAGNTLSARGLIPAIAKAPYLDTSAANQGALITPTAVQTDRVDGAAAVDLGAFHGVNLSTTRTRVDVGVNYHFSDRWAVDASVRPEHKSGLKPMGTVSRNTGGDIAAIIPDKIDTNHNQVDTSLSFKAARGFAQVGYYGSFFTNDVSSMSWENWATAGHTQNVMSSAPGNHFNQLNATAAFKISPATKLVANGSYGRATQNEAFLTDATTPVVPVTSLDGLVVNTLMNAKLTSRPVKKLNLSAAYKYSDRDNRTPVHIYQYSDTGEAVAASAAFPAGPNNPLGAVLAQNANANRPYSRKQNLATFQAEYAVATHQWIQGGYEFEKLQRECNGSWISCSDAATTNENTARVDWRANAGSALIARVGYAYSRRRAPGYNENAFLALVPYANVSPAAATGGATAVSFMNANGWNGWGPALGFAATTGNMNVFFPSNNALANSQYANNNRISELQGLRRYWVADRNRDRVRSSLAWQAGDSVSVQGGVDLNKDDYVNSTYGLQDAKGWGANLDFTYTPSDSLSANLFYTYEKQRTLSAGNSYTGNSNAAAIANAQPGAIGLSGNSCDSFTTLQERNNNNKLDPCLNWASHTRDVINTVGLGVRKTLVKLDLTGDLVFARARSNNDVDGGNWANNVLNGLGGPPTTVAAWFISASPLPTVTSDTAELRLNGIIPLAKRQSLRLAYAYLHMTSDDWVYQGMQIGLGTIAGVLPSNEQAFKYDTNVFGVSYIVSF